MDISKLKKKPKLEKLVINDEKIIETYGEEVTFYMIDYIDISTYFKFYKVQQDEDGSLLNQLLQKLILKEDGTPSLDEGEVFPTDLTLAILEKINDFLGKSTHNQSTQESGEMQRSLPLES